MGWSRAIGIALASVCLLLAAVAPATAASVAELRSRLNEAREKLAELAADELSNVAAVEIERTRIDIDEAERHLTNNLEELAEVSVIRVENRVKLIEALIEQERLERQADELETSTIQLTRQADQAQVEYESTDARRTALRDEVSDILNQLEIEQ